jgi:hypothetical protein
MATIVNLNLGADDGGDGQTYTADLILTSPYVEPAGNLLVLRSRPDVDPIDGSLAVTEATDRGSFEALTRLPIDPVIGTLAVTGRGDTASFSGAVASRATTGTLAATEAADAATGAGVGYVGIVPRTGTLASTEARDSASVTSVFTMKWRASMAATEPGDVGSFSTWFLEYTGPGFLNSTERKDAASFSGRIVYDVAGDLAATEAGDTALIEAETGLVIEAETTDTVIVREVLVGDAKIGSLVDRVWVTDLLEESMDMAFVDTVVASDLLASGLRIAPLLADTVYAADSLYTTLIEDVTDTVVVSETLTMVAVPTALAEVITATDVLTSQSDVSGSLVDTVQAVDSLAWSLFAEVTDQITVSETLVAQFVVTGALTETVTVSEALTAPLTVYAELLDSGYVTDDLASSLALIGVLSDTVLVGDTLTEAAQTVYVVNADTGAVSTYTFTPIVTGMAWFRGTLYLSGPDGLFAVDADEDDDGAVVWTLKTGFSNLGTDLLKRIQDVNIQGRTAGDTTMQVVSDRYGKKQEWNYRLPELTRDSYRDGVVKPGRGVQSVYYALGLHGVGPAEIDQLRVVVEPLSRRR